MTKSTKESSLDYNLRWWASALQIGLFVGPFVVFNLLAEDASEHLSSDYHFLEAIAGCVLVLVPLSLIGFVPSIAKICARDRSRFRQTMKTSVNAAVIVFMALLVSLILYFWPQPGR